MTEHLEDERPDRELVDSLFQRSESTYLLVALLLLIILFPLWEDWRFGEVLTGIFIVAIAVAGVYAVSSSPKAVGLALAVAVPGLLIEGYYILHTDTAGWALIVVPILAVMFFSVVFTFIFGHVLRRGTVTADKLHGAICGYILLGFGWAWLYLLVERLSPGSLIVNEVHRAGDTPSTNDLIYNSFTTLTTTGYGDIIAVTSAARSVAILEQIVGIFYVAIIIARLAGSYPHEPGHRKSTARGTRVLRHKVKR